MMERRSILKNPNNKRSRAGHDDSGRSTKRVKIVTRPKQRLDEEAIVSTQLGDVVAGDALANLTVHESREFARLKASVQRTSIVEFAAVDPDYLHDRPIPVGDHIHDLVLVPRVEDASQPYHVTGFAPPWIWRYDYLARHHQDGALWVVPLILGTLDLATAARWGWWWAKGARFGHASRGLSVDLVSPGS